MQTPANSNFDTCRLQQCGVPYAYGSGASQCPPLEAGKPEGGGAVEKEEGGNGGSNGQEEEGREGGTAEVQDDKGETAAGGGGYQVCLIPHTGAYFDPLSDSSVHSRGACLTGTETVETQGLACSEGYMASLF